MKVGLGVDGSSSADSASLWLEARQAMLLAKLRDGAARGHGADGAGVATLGGAGCLGRAGRDRACSRPGAVGDLAVWRLTGPTFAGCGRRPDRGVAAVRTRPAAWYTVVHGRFVVEQGRLVHPTLDDVLREHAATRAASSASTDPTSAVPSGSSASQCRVVTTLGTSVVTAGHPPGTAEVAGRRVPDGVTDVA